MTRALVDLTAIASNVGALRRWARARYFMAVVKANGYGHGAVEVARASLAAGADWVGVYTVGEGEELRRRGIDAPILVFGPYSAGEARTLVERRLTPTIVDVQGAELLQQAIGETRLPFHLKVDTGLVRAGVSAEDAIPLMQTLTRFPGLQPEGIYTHFACADEPGDSTTRRQLGCFLDVCRRLEAGGFTFSIRHAANSAATLAHPESHLDMVRCGIATYGYYPSAAVSQTVELHPALSLLSVVTRVRPIPRGTGVGYGHDFRAQRPSLIALVPIGYGDGLPRAAGLGVGRVLVRGKLAPIVGRVSMDQITIDVTDVPGVRPGDEVTIIGDVDGVSQTADDLAAQVGTLSYEILTRIMLRVPRVYVGCEVTNETSAGA